MSRRYVSPERVTRCRAKVAYRTIPAARKAAQLYQQRHYMCSVCYLWHCTSK